MIHKLSNRYRDVRQAKKSDDEKHPAQDGNGAVNENRKQ